MRNADVILDIQWLMTLGKVQYDWRVQKMDLKLGNWEIHLREDRSLVKSQISLKSMKKAVKGDAQGVLIELNSIDPTEGQPTVKLGWPNWSGLPPDI